MLAFVTGGEHLGSAVRLEHKLSKPLAATATIKVGPLPTGRAVLTRAKGVDS